MATFNGRSVGKEEGPAQSVSAVDAGAQNTVQSSDMTNPPAASTNFDFNFDDAPA